MKDTIYRQEAIDALYDWELCYTWDEHCRAEYDSPHIVSPSDIINGLPSADPERCEDCGNFNKTMLLIPQPERQMEGNLENVESPRLATYDPEECKQKSKLNADGLISRQDAMAYPLSWDHYDKEHGNRHFIAGVESYREYIEDLPSLMLPIKDKCCVCPHCDNCDVNDDGEISSMSDLISRQGVFIPNITVEMFRNASLEGVEDLLASGEMEDISLPSAESEIIRCKDCKHWDTTWQNDYAPNYHYCPLVDGARRDDFYCADAERIRR